MLQNMRNHNDTRWCPAYMPTVKRIQFISDFQNVVIYKNSQIFIMAAQIKQESGSSHQKFLINQIQKPRQPSKEVAMKIIEEIELGKLKIGQSKRPLIKQKKAFSQADLQGRRVKLVEQIRKNKQKTLRQLSLLQQKQEEIKKELRQFGKSKTGKKKQRSSFSPEQKQRIRQILKLASHQKKKNKERDQLITETYTNYLKKQRQEGEELVEKLRYQHKKAVEHNLLNIQLRRKRREESQKIISQRLIQLKKKKYLHIQKQKLDESQREFQKQQMQEKLSDLRKRFKLDFYEIRQHEKLYEKTLQQKSVERAERQKNQNERYKLTSHKFQNNMFRRIIQNEQNQKKKTLFEKVNQARQMKNKVNQFQTYVKQHYKPKRSIQSFSDMSVNQKKQKSPLSNEERLAQGNAYLKLARKLRKQKDDPKLTQGPKIVKYLTQSQRKSRNVQKFRSLIKTQQSIDYSSAAQAASLLEQMEKKSKKSPDQKLFQSIQNKIDLLKVLI